LGLDVSYHGVYRPRTAADGNTTSIESNNDDDEEMLYYERKQQQEQMRQQQRNKLRRRILMMDLSFSRSKGSKSSRVEDALGGEDTLGGEDNDNQSHDSGFQPEHQSIVKGRQFSGIGQVDDANTEQ
jgi:actin-related protein